VVRHLQRHAGRLQAASNGPFIDRAAYEALANPPHPATPRIKGHPASSTSCTAEFRFTDSTRGVTYYYSLDGGRFGSHGSPVTFRNLSRRTHTFRVYAVLRNQRSRSASFTWRVRLA
jgi:hypothetical protein